MSEWMAGTPKDVLQTNLGVSAAVVEKLPRQSVFVVGRH